MELTDTAARDVEMMNACEESRDSDTPTPLEFAFELLGVNHHDQKTSMVSMVDTQEPRTFFSQGWEAGVESNLDLTQMPSNYRNPQESRAWLVGFVAGQYAGANGYPAPFCIFEGHQH